MPRSILLAAMALFAASAAQAAPPAPAQAAAKAPTKAPTKAQVDAAAFKLRVVISALQSKEVETPLKNVLFACLYDHSMGEISAEVDKVIVANKLSAADTGDVLAVVAGVCGYRPAAGPAKPR